MVSKQLGFLYIRGALFNEVYHGRVKKVFSETYQELLNRKDKEQYSKSIILFMLAMMDNAQEELNTGNLMLAGYDINILHNLPETIYNDWNEDYFYKNELLSYIRNMMEENRIDKVKKVISLVSKYLTDSAD